MRKLIAHMEIEVNEEGYLTDFKQWTKEIGDSIADENGISMTDRHWEVIEYIHKKHTCEEPLSIRGGHPKFRAGLLPRHVPPAS